MRLDLNNGHIFTYQAPATLNQAAPVQNTWYTILDTTANAVVYICAVNVEDTNEDLEVQITIDSETIAAFAVTCNHSTTYYAYIDVNAVALIDQVKLDTGSGVRGIMGRTSDLYGKSIKVEVRKTSANGAGNLTGIVVYGVLEAI